MKRKVLIVDDERGFSTMLALNLESAGEYEVRIENNPRRAFNTTQEFMPDIVLLDVIMPEVEGPDIAFQIRNNSILKNIPIIFLTATITKEEVNNQNGRIGGYPFVAKPSSLNILLQAIEKNIPL